MCLQECPTSGKPGRSHRSDDWSQKLSCPKISIETLLPDALAGATDAVSHRFVSVFNGDGHLSFRFWCHQKSLHQLKNGGFCLNVQS